VPGDGQTSYVHQKPQAKKPGEGNLVRGGRKSVETKKGSEAGDGDARVATATYSRTGPAWIQEKLEGANELERRKEKLGRGYTRKGPSGLRGISQNCKLAERRKHALEHIKEKERSETGKN